MSNDRKDLGFVLLRAVRSIGVERGVDLVLHLLFVRWMTYNDKSGERWATLAGARTDQDLMTAFNTLAIMSELSTVGTETTSFVGALRETVHALDREVVGSDVQQRRNHVAATFDDVLGGLAALGKQAGEADTPRGLARLIVELTVRSGDDVLDPACGNGTGLLLAAKAHPDISVSGFDINLRIARRAAMRLMVHGVESNGGLTRIHRSAWPG